MARPKLTPWFVNGEKPARPGVYNVSCRRTKQSGMYYAYFDGESFGSTAGWVETAWYQRGKQTRWSDAVNQHGSWRGLAEKPE